MIRRSRRVLPATLVALVLLTVAVLVTVSCIQLLAGQQPWLPFAALGEFGSTLTWSHPLVLGVAAVVTLLGVLLLAAALVPGKPTVVPLVTPADHPDTGATRAGLSAALRGAASAVDGVDRAKVRLHRRRVAAKVYTPLREADELAEHVRSAIAERLDDLDPARRLKVRVRVSTARSA